MNSFLAENAAAVILFFVTTVSGYAYFRARFDAKEKRDEEKFVELNKKLEEGDLAHERHDNERFIKLEKYAEELYGKTNKLEIQQGGQNQFNVNVNATLDSLRKEQERTNTKLDTIEGLLRSRRFTDQ